MYCGDKPESLPEFTIRTCPLCTRFGVTAEQAMLPENQPFYGRRGGREEPAFTKKELLAMHNSKEQQPRQAVTRGTVFRELNQPFLRPHHTRRAPFC